MVAERGLPAVIVNPSTPIGPRDVKPTPTGRIIVEAASGRMPGYVDTGLNLVHVDDVAAGHLAAFERGRVGERYILGGENASLPRCWRDIARIAGRRAARGCAFRAPPLCPLAWPPRHRAAHRARALRHARRAAHGEEAMYFSSAKAERELGYRRPAHAKAWPTRSTGSAQRAICT